MKFRELCYLPKSDRMVALVLIGVIVAAIVVFYLSGSSDTSVSPVATMSASGDTVAMAVTTDGQSRYYQQPQRRVEHFAFDPNTADSTQLLRLGLLPWQVRNIYKYRAAGGIYRQKEDFARLYGITVKQYRELEPYIVISDDYRPAALLVGDPLRQQRDSAHAHRVDSLSRLYPQKIALGEHVDLNAMDTTVYRSVPGIGSYYAGKIIAYGHRLGGYVAVDQLDEIDDFPSDAKSYFVVASTNVRKLYINNLSLNELRRHPYINYYQAKAIVDYRRQNGLISDLSDLRLLPDFPLAAIERLRPYVSYEQGVE